MEPISETPVIRPARLLNTKQLCERLGNRSKKTIHRDIVTGVIPQPVRMGGRNYWREDVIEDFIMGLPVGGPTLETAAE